MFNDMRNKIIYTFFILSALSLFSVSCSSSKDNLTYFQNNDSFAVNQGLGNNNYAIRIVPDDELKIVVTSQVPEATAPYNLPMANYATATALSSSATPAIQTYVVDKKGCIVMPIIGKIDVAGKTIDEVAEEIKRLVEKDVKDPYVTVRFCGFRVNVLGEVNSPGAKISSKERYSILDAIADAGDLNVYGKRDNILLIREVDGVKKQVRLSLNDAKLLESPYFYLQQNDIVYVEPNKIRIDNSKYNQNNAFKMSVVSTIVSAASVIASLVIALTVK